MAVLICTWARTGRLRPARTPAPALPAPLTPAKHNSAERSAPLLLRTAPYRSLLSDSG